MQTGLRRYLAGLLLMLLLAALAPVGGARGDNEQPIDLFYNGGYVYLASDLNGAPVIKKGRILVPLRPVAEAMGMKVEWIPLPKSVRLTKGGHNIVIPMGLTYGIIDGRQVNMDAAAEILEDGHAYIPLRFMAEGLGMAVGWHPDERMVTIDDPLPDYTPGPQVHLQVDGKPAQGITTVVRVWLTRGDDPAPLSEARRADLTIIYPDGTRETRSMKAALGQPVFVSGLAFTADVGYAFKVQATMRLASGDLVASQSLKVAKPPLPVDEALLREWDQFGRRPQFATFLPDRELGIWLPAELSAKVEPEMPEAGTEITVSATVLDAYLLPVTDLRGADLEITLTGPDGRGKTYKLANQGRGRYGATINIGYPGYAVQVFWELRLSHQARVLAVGAGSFFVR